MRLGFPSTTEKQNSNVSNGKKSRVLETGKCSMVKSVLRITVISDFNLKRSIIFAPQNKINRAVYL